MHAGGDDMRYTFVNGTDYRSDNISAGVKYQLQAIHMTKVYHYNDTLDMLVISKDPMKTTVRVSGTCSSWNMDNYYPLILELLNLPN